MKRLAVTLTLGLMLPLHALAAEYTTTRLRAVVVDAETNQPITEVAVSLIAQWLPKESRESGIKNGPITLNSTLTNQAGVVSFDYGSIEFSDRDLVWRRDLRNTSLRLHPPEILLFKPGYEFLRLRVAEGTNEPTSSPSDMTVWNGKTIKMQRFRGNSASYAEHLIDFGKDLQEMASVAYSLDACPQKCLSRGNVSLVLLLGKQTEIFEKEKIQPSPFAGFLKRYDQYYMEYGCDSPKMYIRK